MLRVGCFAALAAARAEDVSALLEPLRAKHDVPALATSDRSMENENLAVRHCGQQITKSQNGGNKGTIPKGGNALTRENGK